MLARVQLYDQWPAVGSRVCSNPACIGLDCAEFHEPGTLYSVRRNTNISTANVTPNDNYGNVCNLSLRARVPLLLYVITKVIPWAGQDQKADPMYIWNN
jgi:hypothetical protein